MSIGNLLCLNLMYPGEYVPKKVCLRLNSVDFGTHKSPG